MSAAGARGDALVGCVVAPVRLRRTPVGPVVGCLVGFVNPPFFTGDAPRVLAPLTRTGVSGVALSSGFVHGVGRNLSVVVVIGTPSLNSRVSAGGRVDSIRVMGVCP